MPEQDEEMPTAKSRIKKIGIELEGGWLPTRAPGDLHRDGSIAGLPDNVVVGELASRPIDTLAQATKWMTESYPDAGNRTCGIHFHVSFNELNYSRLMCEDFNNLFLAEMETFYRENRNEEAMDLFRSRLDGQNVYCQKVFRPEQQLWRMEAYGDHGSHPRYSQLNFCFGRHGTMECRLFPYFPNKRMAVLALTIFANCCDTFLRRCPAEKPVTHVIYAPKPLIA